MRSGELKCAVLVACYNRREKTLSFLSSLFAQISVNAYDVDVYLLDDGSTDGTADAVQKAYFAVNIVKGTGNLYWAGGMRYLWDKVRQNRSYDLFLLFNDDVTLIDGSLQKLLTAYRSCGEGTVLVGSTLSPNTHTMSYGGHRLYRPGRAAYYAITPDASQCLKCDLGNANVFLVDKQVVDTIGIFSGQYTHYLADYDYTLTALKAGLNVKIAPGYYGYCEDDHGVNWLSSKHPLRERIRYLYDVKGLAYKEYLHYIKKHFPADHTAAFAKLWLKTLFPFIWDKFKKSK